MLLLIVIVFSIITFIPSIILTITLFSNINIGFSPFLAFFVYLIVFLVIFVVISLFLGIYLTTFLIFPILFLS